MTQPLDGVTVVALEQAVAAPLATRNLADLGARVIKVERIDGGDFARGYDHVVQGTGAHFVWLNRGKESIALDLKTDEGRAVVHRLVDRADVFVQNLAPGAADRLGIGADELRAEPSRADRGGPLRVRHRRSDGAAEGLRHARPGRGRAHLDHRHPDPRPRPASRRRTSPPACTAPRRSWRRCCAAGAPERGPPSRCRCSRRRSSGWAMRSTRRCTPAARHRGWA